MLASDCNSFYKKNGSHLGKSHLSQAGLSVVELMVSIVIGLVVLAGAIQVVVGSKREFLDQSEVQFIQNNARYALDLISKDLRMAGYLGCATKNSIQKANTISNDANGFISLHGLRGFDGEVDTSTFPTDYKLTATKGTDSFIVRHASTAGDLNVKTHSPAQATIQLWDNHDYTAGSTLMITDASCRSVGLFQVSGSNGSDTIFHTANNSGSNPANNCTNIIKGSFDCSSSPCTASKCGDFDKNTGAYGAGSKVMEFVSHAYYIAPSTLSPGMSALMRQVLNSNGAPVTAVEEVAIGVEDFEILYGVDTDGDSYVNQYRNATAMDLDGSGSSSDDEWDQVISVKVSLVFKSKTQVLDSNQARTLAGVNYNDRFMRQVVNSTVRIRNRG